MREAAHTLGCLPGPGGLRCDDIDVCVATGGVITSGSSILGSALEVVTVVLDGHPLGVASPTVRQIVRMVAIEPLPGAPGVIEGVVDLHGEAVGVVDLRARMGFARRPPDPGDHLVITETTRGPLALRVDRAVDFGVVEVAEKAPVSGETDEAIAGVVRSTTGLLIVVDVDRFVSSGDWAALAEALRAAAT